jgi:hypothetical protein
MIQPELRNGEDYCFSEYFFTTDANSLPQVFILCREKIGMGRRYRDKAPRFLETI